MKTIIETATGLSKYLLEATTSVIAATESITVGDPAKFIIGDLNSGNATVYENVTNVPADWTGNKYTFDGALWVLNPDWIDPATLG